MAVTSSRRAVVTLPQDTQILITREFDAPARLVYRAWTEPDLVRRWWSADRGRAQLRPRPARARAGRAGPRSGRVPS
jgi:uncharacterized protein YndB with AHSA1/START domain